ncbi:group IID secretory phospholipase A2 [Suncus etruscus]|uniref:group IID secretory phospholipase A2 n=1 Tax=Suncus etruscus TaxID=109475 RepID=UPI00210FDFE8|nr:group IID secretory phospholipase A2 [Suncus etruscus]
MELALLYALVMLAGMSPTHGSILNLNKMVRRMTGKIPFFSYWPYGCYCGLGGRGQPKDASDWCCKAHDCCYEHLRHDHCRIFTDNYKYTISQGTIECSKNGSWCEKQLCACDKEVALCLKRNLGTYQKRLRNYNRHQGCGDQAPGC